MGTVKGSVNREVLEYLQMSDLPRAIKMYANYIQMALIAKSAKVHVRTPCAALLQEASKQVQKRLPPGKTKLPKMPIITKVLNVGRNVLTAKINVLFAPEPFIYQIDGGTSDLIKIIDKFCIPHS